MAVVAVLHLGTAVALVVYFRQELSGIIMRTLARDPVRRRSGLEMVGHICLASIPAALVGILAESRIESLFASPVVVGPMLIVTGGFLFATRFASDRGRVLDWRVAVLVGMAQAMAILPGISRSGATIAMALLLGLERERAFEFSFILSVPIVLAAAVKELIGVDWSLVGSGALVVGVLGALASGFGALVFLRRMVVGRRFFWFAFYCWAAGLAALLFVR